MNLNKIMLVVLLAGIADAGIGCAVPSMSGRAFAEETKGAPKTGVVKKVDVDGKKIVVMVTRELTFTITDSTKIVKGEEAKKLADIHEGDTVNVEYMRDGDTRTATKISITDKK